MSQVIHDVLKLISFFIPFGILLGFHSVVNIFLVIGSLRESSASYRPSPGSYRLFTAIVTSGPILTPGITSMWRKHHPWLLREGLTGHVLCWLVEELIHKYVSAFTYCNRCVVWLLMFQLHMKQTSPFYTAFCNIFL